MTLTTPPEIKGPKKVGLLTATSLVVGNMIASGVFMLPATLAGYGGISLVGWVISSIGALSLALVFGWLSKLRPNATGGPYAYVRDGMGDFTGYLVAWGYWASVWATNAAIAVAFVSYLGEFIPAIAQNGSLGILTGLGAIWLLTFVNSIGIREAGVVQVVTTILKITPLILIAIGGLFFLNTDHFIPFNASNESDISAITASTTLTLFAFLGLECATIPSENIKDPEKTISRATIIGTFLTLIIYVLGTVSVMGILPPELLKTSRAPFADAAELIWGSTGRYLVAAGAVIATFGALNGWILIQGQMPMAAARDNLFPALFRKERRGTPVLGIVVSSILVSVLMGMNFSRSLADTYKYMILLATMTSLLAYLLSMPSYLILLSRDKVLDRTDWIKITITVIGFIFSLWAIIGSGEVIVFWGFVLLLAGIPFYTVMKIRRR
ncbi:MAG TPA: amino acid permease [Cyclobacteriaceae bacterium]|nr:amino acid permease [Cyclobacteriaceae bacterium]